MSKTDVYLQDTDEKSEKNNISFLTKSRNRELLLRKLDSKPNLVIFVSFIYSLMIMPGWVLGQYAHKMYSTEEKSSSFSIPNL